MRSVMQCEYDIKKYQQLKMSINDSLYDLKKAANSTDDFKASIKDKYLIDDSDSPLVSRSYELQKDIIQIHNHLRSVVLPAIDMAIRELEAEKAMLEAQQK